MSRRRILALWFPRLAAERVLRVMREPGGRPVAVVARRDRKLVLVSLSANAEGRGLHASQLLADAQATCPSLLTVPENPAADEFFLACLHRWTGKFSPWIAQDSPDSLVLDITGCRRLFAGEDALAARIADECRALGLTTRIGIADTVGGAWALARHAPGPHRHHRTGNAIDQEARATRSRAARRRRSPDGTAAPAVVIAPPGGTADAIARLPVAALRLPEKTCSSLSRLGLRRIGDLATQSRGAMTRRFGGDVIERLDQALGARPETVNPARPLPRFAVRLTFPDPVGQEKDLLAGVDRLLDHLCARLRLLERGARRIRLELARTDRGIQVLEATLARATCDPDRIRPLLALQFPTVRAEFGIDCMRLEAIATEPLAAVQQKAASIADPRGRMDPDRDRVAALLDRLGTRVGPDAITRLHPANSHIPEKTAHAVMAAYSEAAAAEDWTSPAAPRPVMIFLPEPVLVDADGVPPARFRWRRRGFVSCSAAGPERIAPEWWFDDPAWRSGVRDYWRVETGSGERLWLFRTYDRDTAGCWFCHGRFG